MPLQLVPAPEGLGWGHFREVRSAPDGSGGKAQTGSLITVPHIVTEKFELVGMRAASDAIKVSNATVRLAIDRQNTWVVQGQKTRSLLEHERLHYMIASLLAKELLDDLIDQAAGTGTELQMKANSLRSDVRKRLDEIEAAYDDDTKNGTIEFQQRLWVAQVHHWRVTGIDW